MNLVSINGRFLTQKLTGVQRFAREMTQALDRKIAAGDVPPELRQTRWRLVVPNGTTNDLALRSIVAETVGTTSGHLWEQTTLAAQTRRDMLIGFGGSGPLLARNQIVVIHDVTIFRHPESFGLSYRAFHALVGAILTRRAKVATVSEFSRGELSAMFRVPDAGLSVLYNAVDHFAALEPDESIVDRLGLRDNRFFLIVGTLKPNKNVDFALRAFAELDMGRKLVVVGGTDPKVFRNGARVNHPDIIFSGRLDDREIAALQRHATAFVFPSLYEGFGIPPLEAMSQSCAVLAADIPAVREACGSGALYFDPYELETLKEAMRAVSADPALRAKLMNQGRENIKRFSWDKTAGELLEIVARSNWLRKSEVIHIRSGRR